MQRRPESDAEQMFTPMVNHGDHVRPAQAQRPAVLDTEQMSTPMLDHGGVFLRVFPGIFVFMEMESPFNFNIISK